MTCFLHEQIPLFSFRFRFLFSGLPGSIIDSERGCQNPLLNDGKKEKVSVSEWFFQKNHRLTQKGDCGELIRTPA
ncbi:MAG: hypothetical protein D6820_15300 [Lentisphaerae bacterium]|nr:MAG: hypothetical protein D6820_15300 [Lentisphaerota bacterium]